MLSYNFPEFVTGACTVLFGLVPLRALQTSYNFPNFVSGACIVPSWVYAYSGLYRPVIVPQIFPDLQIPNFPLNVRELVQNKVYVFMFLTNGGINTKFSKKN